jgi:hypothetical protein
VAVAIRVHSRRRQRTRHHPEVLVPPRAQPLRREISALSVCRAFG